MRLWQVGVYVRALAWAGFNDQMPTSCLDTMSHTVQSVAGGGNSLDIKTPAVVADFDDDVVIVVAQRDVCMRGVGVFTHVRERLLDQPVDRELR